MKLDLGCGASKREGFTGVDCLKLNGVDVVHDLNRFPYPFKDNEADEVWLDNVLEHMENPVRVMEEVHRICKPGARVMVAVPYFRSYLATIDPTHRHFFGIQWFNYFDPGHPFHQKYRYSPATFKVDRVEFDREYRAQAIGWLDRLALMIADRNPYYYEVRLSQLLPLHSLTYYVTVLKS